MKHARKPTRSEKIILANKGLDVKEWLVIRDMGAELMVIQRQGDKGKLIPKKGGQVSVAQNQIPTVSEVP